MVTEAEKLLATIQRDTNAHATAIGNVERIILSMQQESKRIADRIEYLDKNKVSTAAGSIKREMLSLGANLDQLMARDIRILDKANNFAAHNVEDALAEIAAGYVDGSGTANYVPKWSDTDTLANSAMYDNSGLIGIGLTTSAANILHLYANNSTDVLETADKQQLLIEQDGTGDAGIGFELTGLKSYSLGIDNSDSDHFKLRNITEGYDVATFRSVTSTTEITTLYLGTSALTLMAWRSQYASIYTETGLPLFIDGGQGAGNASIVIHESQLGVGVHPTSSLHVKANNATDLIEDGLQQVVVEQDGTGDAVMSFLLTAGQQWSIGIDNSASDAFVLRDVTRGADVVSATTGGNVGISAPSIEAWDTLYRALQIGSNSAFMSLSAEGASNAFHMMQNTYYDGAWKRMSTDEASQYYQYQGTHQWFGDASGTADLAFTPTIRMKLSVTGSLGINIDPLYFIHASRSTNGGESFFLTNANTGSLATSTIAASHDGNNIIFISQYGVNTAMSYGGLTDAGMSTLLSQSANGLLIEEYSNKPIYFATNNVTREYLTGDAKHYYRDGAVAHGMTTLLPTDVYRKDMILSATNGGALVVGASDADATALHLLGARGGTCGGSNNAAIILNGSLKSGTDDGAMAATDKVLAVQNHGTERLHILGDGTIGVTQTAHSLKAVSVTLADDASVALETILPSNCGFITIMGGYYALTTAFFSGFLQGDDNDITVFHSQNWSTSDVDTDGCLIADGDTTYTLKNRIGASVTFVIWFIGLS